MKQASTLAMAVAMIAGFTATTATVETASAWGNERPGGWHGMRGPMNAPMNALMNGPMRGPKKMMKQFDTDGDKALSREELDAGLQKKITDNDTDDDQAISLEEFKAEWLKMTQDRMVRAFQHMDRDGSGTITAEELKEQAGFMFDRMDSNEDGKIDKADRPKRSNNKFGNPRPGRGMYWMDRPGRQNDGWHHYGMNQNRMDRPYDGNWGRGRSDWRNPGMNRPGMNRPGMNAMPYHGCMQPGPLTGPNMERGMEQDMERGMGPKSQMQPRGPIQQPPQPSEAPSATDQKQQGSKPAPQPPAPDTQKEIL